MGLLDMFSPRSGGGLLGNLDDPQNVGQLNMALGLLAAGGPSTKPIGLGQAFAQAAMLGQQGYQGALDRQSDREDKQAARAYRNAQIGKLTREAESSKELNDFFKSRLYGSPGTMPAADMSASRDALSQGAEAGDIGPTATNAARMNAIRPPQLQGPNSAFPFGLNDIAFLKTKGVDLADVYKLATEPIEYKSGSTYRDRGTGVERFMPKYGEGMAPGVDGVVSAAPGYTNTVAAIEAAKQRAAEEQKAAFDPLPLGFAGIDGRPIGGSRLNYINRTSPQPAPTAQSAPSNFPTVSPQAQAARDREALLYAKQDIDNATTPEAKAQLRQVYDTMVARANAGQSVITGNASAQGGVQLQSDAEKEAAVGREKAKNAALEAKLKSDQERSSKDNRLYSQISAAIPMARKLLKEATGSGAGALADNAMAFFGQSTKGADAAQALDTIGGWMTSNVPRMEGPQSNVDVQNYQIMAARIADRTLPTESRLAALNVLETLQNKYAHLNGLNQDANASNWKNHGYSNEAAVVQDARNAMLRNPSAKAEIIRRLEASGITNHGLK